MFKKKKILVWVLPLFLLLNCRKEELEGKNEWLMGKWKAITGHWVYTTDINHPKPTYLYLKYEYPPHYLEFKPDGRLIISDSNGIELDRGKIIKLNVYSTGSPVLEPMNNGFRYHDYFFNIELKCEKNYFEEANNSEARPTRVSETLDTLDNWGIKCMLFLNTKKFNKIYIEDKNPKLFEHAYLIYYEKIY